jgi:hypothetical protein
VTLEQKLAGLELHVLCDIAERIGALASRWHTVAPGPLALRAPRTRDRKGLHLLLSNEVSEGEAVQQVQRCLSLDAGETARSREAIRRSRALPPVPIHGDVHEGQILVDPADGMRLSGVIDWQTAAVDHPFAEFDFGEWGPTIWREHRASFPELRARYWQAYAPPSGLEPDLGPVFEWVHAAARALTRASGEPTEFGPETIGTLEEAVAEARTATSRLPG